MKILTKLTFDVAFHYELVAAFMGHYWVSMEGNWDDLE